MSENSLKTVEPARMRGAALLTLGGIAAAFGVASCCALPILLTAAGLSAAWLGGVASLAAPYRTILLLVSALSLIGGAVLLWRMQQRARACGPGGIGARLALRVLLLVGLLTGAVLLWLGYSYA